MYTVQLLYQCTDHWTATIPVYCTVQLLYQFTAHCTVTIPMYCTLYSYYTNVLYTAQLLYQCTVHSIVTIPMYCTLYSYIPMSCTLNSYYTNVRYCTTTISLYCLYSCTALSVSSYLSIWNFIRRFGGFLSNFVPEDINCFPAGANKTCSKNEYSPNLHWFHKSLD